MNWNLLAIFGGLYVIEKYSDEGVEFDTNELNLEKRNGKN